MATAQIFEALGALGAISDFIGGTPLTLAFSDGQTIIVNDANGDGFALTGIDLAYDATGLTGGTFTGLRIFSGTDATLETLTDFSTPAKPLFALYQFGGIGAAVLDLFKGDDAVTGSAIADMLFGFAGNDVIKGGGGNDIIAGSVGRDKLFGQGGADTFIYVAGDGKDMIMDFTDKNGASDDLISVSKKMYANMTFNDNAAGTGVVLHFGKGEIDVAHWHAADVDVTDFLLV